MTNDQETSATYRPRLNRMMVSGVTARFGDEVGVVANIALGGVLLRLPRALKVGAEGRLMLLKGPAIITVQATVLRRRLVADPHDHGEAWLVALKFTAGHEELRPLIAHLLHPTPTHELTRWSSADFMPRPAKAERHPFRVR